MVEDSAKPGKYTWQVLCFVASEKYGLFAPFLKLSDALKCRYCCSSC